MLHHSSNAEILRQLDQVVIGHTDAKKQLISAVNRSKIKHQQLVLQDTGFDVPFELTPSKILLIGGSGTGKTFLIHQLQKIVHFPLICVDASSFNPAGSGEGGLKASGLVKKIKDYASQLYQEDLRYHSYQGVLNQLVVFVDEVDKLASHWGDGKWNSHVQSNFLTLFGENSPFPRVTWVFAGAFTDIDRKSAKSKGIGFVKEKETVVEDKPITDEDIIKYGLIPELVGRLTHIVELDRFDKDILTRILVENLWPIKMQELEFFAYGDINLTDDQIKTIVEKVLKNNLGVRGLKRELDKLFVDAEFYCEDVPQKYLPVEELILLSDEKEFFEDELSKFIYKD